MADKYHLHFESGVWPFFTCCNSRCRCCKSTYTTGICEFVLTDSAIVEANDLALKEVMRAAENLYAFAEAFGQDLLTDEGKKQVTEAFNILKRNGSRMFPPNWMKDAK